MYNAKITQETYIEKEVDMMEIVKSKTEKLDSNIGKEINSMYIMKAVCSIIVIFLHCPFPGFLGRFIAYFFRFSVPIFFMISGYFSKDEFKAYRKRILSTLKYLLSGEIICMFVRIVISLCKSNDFLDILLQAFSNKNIFITVFCGTFFNGTLWYLYASLWTYIAFWAWKQVSVKMNLHLHYPLRVQIIVILSLLACGIFGRLICQNITDINTWIWVFRSFLLQGIPFMIIGKLIRNCETTLLKRLSIKISFIGLASAGLLACIEYITIRQYMDVYCSTVIISFLLFVIALHLKEICFLGYLKWIGKNVSGYMYIWHLPVIEIIKTVLPGGGYLLPVLAVCLTIVVSIIYYAIIYLIGHNRWVWHHK